MDAYILKMTDKELAEMTTNIDSKKLCFFMLSLGTTAQNKIYSTMSSKAQEYLKKDVKDLSIKVQG